MQTVYVAAIVVAGLTALPGMASINLATGLDTSDNVITTSGGADAHWTVIGGAPAQVATASSPGGAIGAWVNNNSVSAWILGDASTPYGNAQGNNSVYSRQFDLSGYLLSSVTLGGGAWAVDDTARLVLNGNPVSSLPVGQWGALTPFSVPNSYFLPGVNTLEIRMGWTDNVLEGARLEGTIEGVAVPEPSTWLAGFALCLTMAGPLVRRVRKE